MIPAGLQINYYSLSLPLAPSASSWADSMDKLVRECLPAGCRDLISMIVQYTGKSRQVIFCWKFHALDDVLSWKRGQPQYHVVLHRWRPEEQDFSDRDVVMDNVKNAESRHCLVFDDNTERLFIFQNKRILIRDMKDPDQSTTVNIPLEYPYQGYGARGRVDDQVYFLYEKRSWGESMFSSFDLKSLQWKTLRAPELKLDDKRPRFQPDGSHLLQLNNTNITSDGNKSLWHLNDQWHNYRLNPFLHRYYISQDRWDDEKYIIEIPEIGNRKKYACVPYAPPPRRGGENIPPRGKTGGNNVSFLVIGGLGRIPGPKTMVDLPVTECSIVTLIEDEATPARTPARTHVSPFAELEQSGYRVTAHQLSDHLYVTCHPAPSSSLLWPICVQRLEGLEGLEGDAPVGKPGARDARWTIVHQSNSGYNLYFCNTL